MTISHRPGRKINEMKEDTLSGLIQKKKKTQLLCFYAVEWKVVQLFLLQFAIFSKKIPLGRQADKITLIQEVKASLVISNSYLILE